MQGSGPPSWVARHSAFARWADEVTSVSLMKDKHEFHFRLYVCGHTGRSQRAIAVLQKLCEEKLAGRSELEVIDVLAEPGRADEDRVLATPTLIKLAPAPIRRVVGDLSDPSRLGEALDLPD